MINSKNIFFLAVLFSTFAILSAFFMQYVLGHAPCKLCTYQRIPYYIIILIGLITLFFPKIIKLTFFLLIFFMFNKNEFSLVKLFFSMYSKLQSSFEISSFFELKINLVLSIFFCLAQEVIHFFQKHVLYPHQNNV